MKFSKNRSPYLTIQNFSNDPTGADLPTGTDLLLYLKNGKPFLINTNGNVFSVSFDPSVPVPNFTLTPVTTQAQINALPVPANGNSATLFVLGNGCLGVKLSTGDISYTNPMLGPNELIIGGNSGLATRLARGANGSTLCQPADGGGPLTWEMLPREAPEDGTLYGRKNGGWLAVPAAGIADAPNDTNLYGRKGQQWVIVPAGGDGLADAPSDGTLYGRKSGAWVMVPAGGGIAEAPEDGQLYARSNGAWVVVTSQSGGGGGSGPTLGTQNCTYQTDGDSNGAFYFMGQGFNGTNTWMNPYTTGRINIVSNAGISENNLSAVVDRTTSYVGLYPASGTNTYILVTLGTNVTLTPNKFSYQFRPNDNNYTTGGIQLEGSVDGNNWTNLGTHNGLTPVEAGWVTFDISSTTAYHYFRLTETQSYNGSGYFYIGEFELYGALSYPTSAPTGPKTYTYASDGDANGLFYGLGAPSGFAWVNPQANGGLTVTTNHGFTQGNLASITDRQPSDTLVGDVSDTGTYLLFDLGSGHSCACSRYSYRNRSSDGSSCPQAWSFQGSSDGVSWTVLDQKSGLTWAGGSIWLTSALSQSPQQSYRYFKFLQIDPNNTNGGNNYFAVGEFEMYGTYT